MLPGVHGSGTSVYTVHADCSLLSHKVNKHDLLILLSTIIIVITRFYSCKFFSL
jgi:hypothetical protein